MILQKETSIQKLLSYFMGKNTPERQRFIIDNLKVEKNVEELALAGEVYCALHAAHYLWRRQVISEREGLYSEVYTRLPV